MRTRNEVRTSELLIYRRRVIPTPSTWTSLKRTMDFEQSDSILKDYGLEHNFVSMDLIVKMGQPIEYWAPARSFPSVSLVQKLSKPVSVPMNQDLMVSLLSIS